VPKIHVIREADGSETTVEFRAEEAPFTHEGEPASILDALTGHDVELEHACGGKCACTTCHVIVKAGMENLSEMQDEEADRLDEAVGLTSTSRLGCQAVVKGDVTVVIPRYHRNN
jgi:2Fe-2S ferredoxin